MADHALRTVKGGLAVLDLRNEETIYAGNCFIISAVSAVPRVDARAVGVKQQNTVFAIAKSILERGSPIDIGAICLSYDGGGHQRPALARSRAPRRSGRS